MRIGNDYRHLREACRDAEQRLGLTGTAPADRTAATHVPRAEVEKTRRTRGASAVPDRAWLRKQVQLTASWARNPSEFLDGLRGAGVAVRERRDPGGVLTGYAVARLEPTGTAGTGPLVFYGGGKLAPDLTLPQLITRWPDPGTAPAGRPLPSLSDLQDETSNALAHAINLVRAQGALAPRRPGRPLAVDDVTSAGADLLRALAWQVDGRDPGPVARAATQYPRAGRAPGGRRAAPTPSGTHLRELATLLLRTSRAQSGQGDWARVLVQALDLVASVAELRRAQQHPAQHAAALAAAHHLQQAVRPPARPLPAWAASLADPSVRVKIAADNAAPRGARRSTQPRQGRGRSR